MKIKKTTITTQKSCDNSLASLNVSRGYSRIDEICYAIALATPYYRYLIYHINFLSSRLSGLNFMSAAECTSKADLRCLYAKQSDINHN